MNYSRIRTSQPEADGHAPDGKAQGWLTAQLAQLPEAQAGLVLENRNNALLPSALWPSASGVAPLLELCERAGTGGKGLVTELRTLDALGANYAIAWPLRQDGVVLAVAALAVRAEGEAALQEIMRKLQWGAAGLELMLAREASAAEQARVQSLENSVDLLASVLAEDHFDGAAMAFVTGLAGRLDAERVSLGLTQRGAIRVMQMSHSSQFGDRMNLVRLIEAAMDEAADQRLPVLVPAAPDGPIRLAHDRLVAEEPGAVMTVPLYIGGEPVGALTAERAAGRPFDDDELRMVESLSALAVTALEEKRRNDRPLPAKIWDAVHDGVSKVMQPGRMEYRLALALVVLMLGALAFARGTDNLSADATLAPRLSRILASPFDGYVKTAPLRAGDHVRKDQVIATLDDSDLQLERAKWLSQLSRYGGLTQDAAASLDRVQTTVNSAERDEAQAQLDLTDALIARAALRAPFDGLVVSGDLSQRIGGTVTKGEVLYTVAPTGNYRVDLQIKESRIASTKVGQRGVLHLSALPARTFNFTVTKITPKTVAQNGATYFMIEGALDAGQDLSSLQPGMEGVGKVDVGRGWLVGIWTRDLAEWLRLKLWGLFG